MTRGDGHPSARQPQASAKKTLHARLFDREGSDQA
jgi:hypothetical protein